jgi:predicted ArsR family transcriptional regulator
MEEKVLIDRETLKAIAVDTRINILKLLSKKSYTLSDIANMLGLGASTVKEHLDILAKAKLVKKEKTERKWKYYSLTFKGRRFIEPREVKVLFAFVITLIAAVGTAFVFAKKFILNRTQKLMVAAPEMSRINAMDAVEEGVLAKGTEELPAAAQELVSEGLHISLSNPSTIMLIALLVLIALSAFLLGNLLKKPQIIITKKGDKK